jgi:hypothetical protein
MLISLFTDPGTEDGAVVRSSAGVVTIEGDGGESSWPYCWTGEYCSFAASAADAFGKAPSSG